MKSGAPTFVDEFGVEDVSAVWAEAAAEAGAVSCLHLHCSRTGCMVSQSSAAGSTRGIPAQYVVNGER